MDVDSFQEMYVAELQELRSVEEQLVRALPRLAEQAEHSGLKEALLTHLEETSSQCERLDVLLSGYGANPREHRDQSMQAIIAEAEKWAAMVEDRDLRDAGLLASVQRVEHYEIAVYGTMATWAKQLGHHGDLRILLEILDEEKRADEKLTELAKAIINPEAEALGHLP